MDYGELLKDIRKQRGLTQVELAKKLNLTQSWVSYVEGGKEPGHLVRRIVDDYVKYSRFKPTVKKVADQPVDHSVENSRETVEK